MRLPGPMGLARNQKLRVNPFSRVWIGLLIRMGSERLKKSMVVPAKPRSLREGTPPLNATWLSKPSLPRLVESVSLRRTEGAGLYETPERIWAKRNRVLSGVLRSMDTWARSSISVAAIKVLSII